MTNKIVQLRTPTTGTQSSILISTQFNGLQDFSTLPSYFSMFTPSTSTVPAPAPIPAPAPTTSTPTPTTTTPTPTTTTPSAPTTGGSASTVSSCTKKKTTQTTKKNKKQHRVAVPARAQPSCHFETGWQ